MHTHGFAVVGTGNIAQAHIDAVRKLPNARLVGVTSRSLDKAGEVAREHGVKLYPRYEQPLTGRSGRGRDRLHAQRRAFRARRRRRQGRSPRDGREAARGHRPTGARNHRRRRDRWGQTRHRLHEPFLRTRTSGLKGRSREANSVVSSRATPTSSGTARKSITTRATGGAPGGSTAGARS